MGTAESQEAARRLKKLSINQQEIARGNAPGGGLQRIKDTILWLAEQIGSGGSSAITQFVDKLPPVVTEIPYVVTTEDLGKHIVVPGNDPINWPPPPDTVLPMQVLLPDPRLLTVGTELAISTLVLNTPSGEDGNYVQRKPLMSAMPPGDYPPIFLQVLLENGYLERREATPDSPAIIEIGGSGPDPYYYGWALVHLRVVEYTPQGELPGEGGPITVENPVWGVVNLDYILHPFGFVMEE